MVLADDANKHGRVERICVKSLSAVTKVFATQNSQTDKTTSQMNTTVYIDVYATPIDEIIKLPLSAKCLKKKNTVMKNGICYLK